MEQYSFGYPRNCSKCNGTQKLKVPPYFKEGGRIKLMLIGQDPTIFRAPDRVKSVLMLDDKNSQLSRWLKQVFGENNFQTLTLYATNIVKCSFENPPSTTTEGGLMFLRQYFKNCKDYLNEEIRRFKPSLVLTLGEPAHKLFIETLDNYQRIEKTMKKAFTGELFKVELKGLEFDYSPCLHIKTFRVAETYGDCIKKFKEGIRDYFGKIAAASNF